jgi:threonine dehydratase
VSGGPTLPEVRAARARIAPRIRRTPLVRSEWLSRPGQGEVFLKLESLQVTHSFKARGALNALLALRERLPAGSPPPLVVTASAGNHGLALAWAAELAGAKVVIFTPRNAPTTKLDAIRGYRADLRPEAATYEDAERLAKQFAAATGAHFISAYSHPDLLTAIGSIALEILEDLPGVGRMVVPVGGGGLVAGIAAAAKAVKPSIEIAGVEVEASHAFTSSLAAGRIVEVEVAPTLADGLAGNMDPENLAFPIVRSLVDRVEVVSEEALRLAVAGLVRHEHLVAEGAGAVGVAAVLEDKLLRGDRLQARAPGEATAIVISGSNIDAERLVEVIRRAGHRPGRVDPGGSGRRRSTSSRRR